MKKILCILLLICLSYSSQVSNLRSPQNPNTLKNIGYVETNSNYLSNVGCFKKMNGEYFFDQAVIFAANINSENDKAVLNFNPQV